MGEVSGAAKAADELHEFVGAIASMPPVLARIASQGADIMRPLVPVDTGALRATVRAEVIQGEGLITAGSPTVDYAPIVNARSRFIERTITALEPTAVQQLEDGISDEIESRGLNR